MSPLLHFPRLAILLCLIVVGGLLSAALTWAAEVRFDSRTSVLSVPELNIDGQTTINDVQLQLLPGRPWSLFAVGTTRSGISYPRQTSIVGFLGSLNPETVFKLADNGELWSGCSVTLTGWTAGDPSVTIYRTGENAYLMQFDGTITTCTPAPFQQFAGNSPLTSFTVQPPMLTGQTGETLQFMVAGGTPPYSVLAANPVSLRVLTPSIAGSGLAGSAQLTGQSGDTVLIIGDAAGRMLLLPVTRSATTSELQLTPSQLEASAGQIIVLAIGGGRPPYQVNVTHGALLAVRSLSPDAQAPRATVTVEALAGQGNAHIVVVDATGASASSSVQLRPAGSASTSAALAVLPARLSATAGQRLNLTIAGGTAPYRVTSSQPALVGVRAVDQDAAAARASVALEVTGTAGSAVIGITDAAGASVSAVVDLAGGPSSALPLTLAPTSLKVSRGETALLSIAGGAAPYQVASSMPAMISVRQINQDAAAARATVTLDVLAATGSAVITVIDALGNIASVPVSIQAAGPSSALPLSLVPASLSAILGQQLTVGIAGGAAPYRFSLSHPELASIEGFSADEASARASVTLRIGSQVGLLTLTVIDATGASASAPITIQAGPASLAPLSVRPTTLEGRFGSAVSLAIAGGAAPYAVTSSNNAVLVVRKVEHHSQAASATVSLYLSGRGSASVVISDAAGNSVDVPVVVE